MIVDKNKLEMTLLLIIPVLILLILSADIYAEGIKLKPNVVAGDHFGYSSCLYGDYAIVGAALGEGKKGSAYIFKYDDNSWKEQAILTAKDGQVGDLFGRSVAITDRYAFVGASDDDNDMGAGTGTVYIYRLNGISWDEDTTLRPHGQMIESCQFGWSISASGNYLIVGSPMESWRGGAIYIFECVNDKWMEQAKLASSNWAPGDYLSVSIEEDSGTGWVCRSLR